MHRSSVFCRVLFCGGRFVAPIYYTLEVAQLVAAMA
jgi:hypothetical protein